MANQGGANVEMRLWRLWKGTLVVAAMSAYALLVTLLFLHHGWRAALLALFFIVVSQVFRYIANDVDRIGWNLQRRHDSAGGGDAGMDGGDGAASVRYQLRLFWLLVGLAQLLNIVLVGQAFELAGVGRAVATLAGLTFVEVLFSRIRKVNRRVEFQQASYGLSDGLSSRGALDASTSATAWDAGRLERLQRKLERLKDMAEAGEISQRAYEKARDKALVRSVMDDEAPPSRQPRPSQREDFDATSS